MSANKTQNFGLHVWEAGDDFLREEFNENFAAIDTQAVRVVFGSYTGNAYDNSAVPQLIELGGKPKAVIVMRYDGLHSTSSGYSFGGMGGPGLTSEDTLFLVDEGFQAANNPQRHGFLNKTDYVYYFLALM